LQSIKSNMRSVILFAAVFADAALLLSAPEKISFAGLGAFLALLLSLVILFSRAIEWPGAGNSPLPAVAALALCGLNPAAIASVSRAVDSNLCTALAGIAAGIAICRWIPSRGWHRWAALLPAIPCLLLHKVGIAFGPLAIVSALCFDRRANLWPTLAISAAAGVIYRGVAFHPVDSIVAVPATIASFVAPFAPSAASGWNVVDGVTSTLVVLAGAMAPIAGFGSPGISFGLFWFLAMTWLAPGEPVAAFPGIAIALVSAVLPLLSALRAARKPNLPEVVAP
jgi:hypothetical protein